MLRAPVEDRPFECWTFGSECDGGFAQFTVAPARDTYAVRSDRSDVELAALPCSYSTTENMLQRAFRSRAGAGDGPQGGVGARAVRLRETSGRDAVVAQYSAAKAAEVRAQGADRTEGRGAESGG